MKIDWAHGLTARIPRTTSRRPSLASRPAHASRAAAQHHLRQVLASLGMLVVGGEAYVSFKPDLIDANRAVTDEGARKFLRSFVGQFAALVARFADPQRAAVWSGEPADA